MATEPTPTRKTSEATLDQWNAALRMSPLYAQYFASIGIDPSKPVKLSDRQQEGMERFLRANGVDIPEGMHIDPAGNLNQKNRLLRNIGVGAAIGGAALTGLGAAGIGPLSGLLGGAGAAGGAASTAAPLASSGGAAAGVASTAVPAAIASGGASAGIPLAAGAGGSGILGALGGLVRDPRLLSAAGRMMTGAGEAQAQNRGAEIEALLAKAALELQARGSTEGAFNNRAQGARVEQDDAWRTLNQADYTANWAPRPGPGVSPYTKPLTGPSDAVKQAASSLFGSAQSRMGNVASEFDALMNARRTADAEGRTLTGVAPPDNDFAEILKRTKPGVWEKVFGYGGGALDAFGSLMGKK